MKTIDLEQELQGPAGKEQSLKVLVVDDSPVYHKLVADALFYQPYSILRAESGREALDLFVKHSPPIVITDWMMPDLSGPDLCKRIRTESRDRYTYIIMLTSMSDNESLLKGLEAGADEFLTKPFDPAELQARMGVGRRIVQLHRQVDAKNRQIEESSRIDPVTGLPNHRAIQEWATWQLMSAAQNGFSAWLVLADVDSFGQINEQFGREAGDAVLKEFSRIIKDSSLPADIIGRAGDDELICLLTHVSKSYIAAAIERYRTRFAEHEFRFGEKILTATASFGAIGFEGDQAPSFESLVLDAETALNAAKIAGGNQYSIATKVKTISGV
jgi:two-component system, cell cycle response regulator